MLAEKHLKRSPNITDMTDVVISAARTKPGQRRLELRDAKVRGLELRVTDKGQKSWAFIYWHAKEGKAKRVTLDPYPAHDELRTLTDQQIPRSMQHQSCLLFSGFDRSKPHQRTRHSLADGCCTGGIVLGPLNVALHVARGASSSLCVSKRRDLPRPIVRRAAGFHADEAWGELAEKLDDLFAPQLPGDDNFAVAVDAMKLEDILCEINADGANLHVDDPLR